jgi:CubicO group peptidase (beta-lactamase class C family)
LILVSPRLQGQGIGSKAAALFDRVIKTGTPGVSAGVAVKGTVVFSGGAGVTDLETRTPVTASTLFNIGSVSKVITAAALMQLIEQGKVRLDDPIRTYVPTFPDKGPPITIRQLATHTSGLRHYLKETDQSSTHYSFEQSLSLFKDDPLLFPPGTLYFYSSYGVNLLQGVIEKAGGVPFEEYMRQHVWKPAGMSRTQLDVPGRTVTNRARAYNVKDNVARAAWANELSYAYASGGMLSTADDLVRFGMALNQGRLMRRDSVEKMYATYVDPVMRFEPNGPPSPMDFRQALLWRGRADFEDGRPYFYHCGSVNSFNACIANYRREDVVAVILVNAENTTPAGVGAETFAHLVLPTRPTE